MEIRDIAGRRATDRDGAAEVLGRSPQTVSLLSSPKQRAQGSGFPAPIATIDGKKWYAVDELHAFGKAYLRRVADASAARVHDIRLDGDPEEEISAVEFRTLIDANHGTWSKYVDMSKRAWGRGEDGYLPKPDREEPAARRGVSRYWKRHRVQQWINNRPGRGAGAGAPVRAADTEPNTPKYRQVAEALQQEIATGALTAGQRLPSEAALAERHGVSSGTVRRALAKLREEQLVRQTDEGVVVA